MASTIYGPATVEQQDEVAFEAQRGLVRTRHIRGRRADVESFLDTEGLTAFPYNISPEAGGLCEAVVQLGGADPGDPDTPISIEWNYSANTLQNTLWEHPKVIAPLAALSTADMTALRKWINDVKEGSMPATTSPPISNADIDQMAQRIVRGKDSWWTPQATLVQNIRLSPATSVWPNLASISTVYSNAQLIATFGVPADVAAKLPLGEWLSMRVDYQRDSAGYRNTTQEWAFSHDWDNWIYPHAPTPLSEEMKSDMERLLVKFEDWLVTRPLPGLTPPAR